MNNARRGAALAVTCLALGACATAAPGPPAPSSPAAAGPGDPAESYLAHLIAGDRVAVLAGFSGEPSIDDPMGGRVRGSDALDRFVAERHDWLGARSARLVPGRVTRDRRRTVVEAVLDLKEGDRAISLPVAVVADRAPDGRAIAIRVYHSLWPLYGKHRVRAPLLPVDPALHLTGAVEAYQRALAAGDVEGILATFEPDGYFREPSGGIYVHRGLVELRAFMTQVLGAGGVGLEHATLTDDGVVAAIEINIVRFGQKRLTPQAELQVYERGASGRLAAARIYDDVAIEELAGLESPSATQLASAEQRGR